MDEAKGYQGRIFAGILIILVGILFLFGIFSTYWPLILIYVGVWHLITRNFRDWGFGLIVIAVGIFFMLVNWGVWTSRVWRYLWPLLIIAIGLWLILRPRMKTSRGKFPEIKDKDLDSFTFFSGIKHRVESQEFRGGKATALFGGLELDFTPAMLAEGKAAVELTALFGGIEIKAPKNWEVVVDSSTIFGGVEDKREKVSPSEVKATLYVKATAIFGGIEIK